MPQPLANGWQTDPAIDQFSRMRMPKLVQRAGDACLRAVVVPSFLHRLVTQWSSSSVLFRSEQGPVLVAPAFEVGSELLHQTWIVEQDRSPLPPFPTTVRCSLSSERSRSSTYKESPSLTRRPVSESKRKKSRSRRHSAGIAVRMRSIWERSTPRGCGGSSFTRSILRIGLRSSSSCCSAQVRKRATAACLRALVAGRRWACISKNARKTSAVTVCIDPW